MTESVAWGRVRLKSQPSHSVERFLVRVFEQPPRDHLRLNIRRTLEDIKDARVTEDTADGVLERKAVAAVNLHGVVRRRPRDARGEQFRHTGFQIAAPPGVLF